MKNDGGSAYPVAAFVEPSGEFNWGDSGMSLRDYFAAAALPCATQVALEVITKVSQIDEHSIAKMAYTLADAMLAAREE